MIEKDRNISILPQDILATILLGYTLPPMFISEEEIAAFCKGCDFSNSEVCSKVGANDQARYAARKGCGWAVKDGVRGSMTAEGLKS